MKTRQELSNEFFTHLKADGGVFEAEEVGQIIFGLLSEYGEQVKLENSLLADQAIGATRHEIADLIRQWKLP